MKYKEVEGLGEKAKKKVGERSVLDEILFKSISFGTGKEYVVEDGDILASYTTHPKHPGVQRQACETNEEEEVMISSMSMLPVHSESTPTVRALKNTSNQYIDPRDFCHAYKDYEGNPMKVHI